MWFLAACTTDVIVSGTDSPAPDPAEGDDGVSIIPGTGEPDDTGPDSEDNDDPYGCSSIFEQDKLPDYHVEIASDQWEALKAAYAAYDGAKEYYPALSFSDDDETLENVSLRLKGNEGYSWGVAKMQFVVSFVEVDEDQRFHGVRHIAFDAPWYEQTLVHNRLSAKVLHQLGIPAPCTNNARLTINGEYQGLYAAMEQPDKEYLQRNFGDEFADGNLYKYGYILANNPEATDHTRMESFWATYDVPTLETYGDVHQWISEWAAEAVINDADGYWCCGHNYYLYDHPENGFMYLPWDLDATFNYVGTPFLDPLGYPYYAYVPHEAAIIGEAAYQAEFVSRVSEYKDAVDWEQLAEDVDVWSRQIDESMQEDTKSSFSYVQWQAAIADQITFMRKRESFLDAWVDHQ